jgi:formate dehydrogenase alpha subunit
VAGLATSFGSGAMTNSIGEIGEAACILAIGTNTTAAHPVIGVEIKRALRGGGKLIVANPREISLCRMADIWLQHRPGSDVALLMGLMWIIVDEGLLDLSFIQERCENFESFLDSLKEFHPAFAAQVTGIPAELLAQAARMFATSKPATILYTMGITQHTHGTDNVMATANLAMLTGNIGKPSTGVNPLRGQNNVQGACDMGSLPTVYSGYQSVADAKVQQKFQEAWGCKLSPTPGRTLTEIIEAAHLEPLKAIYLVGENPVLSDPDATHVRKALERLEFLVVQDIFLTETAQLADVVLPAASFAEKDGTFTNTERRVQRVRKVIESPGESRPDWWITCQIARLMGAKGFDYQNPEEIMSEIARLTPSYGGLSYQRIEQTGLQWPCPTTEHPGTVFLHKDTFSRGKGKFAPLQYRPSAEQPDADYPLILTTERSLYHFHTSTMTRKVKGLRTLRTEELVEINPADAQKLGITDGQMVKVSSRRGQVTATARVTSVSPPGVISMTFHFAESPTNVLTSPALDPIAKIPELKVAAVRVEPCAPEETAPAPARAGSRT